jgi:hypothetical protein
VLIDKHADKRRRRWSRRPGWLPGVILGAIGLVFAAVGAYILLVEAPRQDEKAHHIRDLPGATLGSFSDQRPGTEVAVTGVLTGNFTLQDQPYDIAQYEVVAYQVDQWDVTSDSDSGPIGTWGILTQNMPGLAFDFAGQTVWLLREDTSKVTISGETHEFVVPSSTGDKAQYNGRDLREGSLRIRGFRNGDVITVVGETVRPDYIYIIPERVHAGDRQNLVDSTQAEANTLRLFSVIFGCLGSLFVIVPVSVAGFKAWRRR